MNTAPLSVEAEQTLGTAATQAAESAEPSAASLSANEVPENKRGVFGFLKRNKSAPNSALFIAPVQVDTPDQGAAISDTEVATTDTVDTVAPDADARPRLLGFLRRDTPGEEASDASESVILVAAVPSLEDTMSDPDPDQDIAPPDPAPETRRGLRLFGGGRRGAIPAVPDQPGFDSPPGVVPFGEVIRNCDVKARNLGTEVDSAQGGAKYRLYDTAPSSTIPRTQFLTGFKDGCARQFTGSLALFGAAEVHEVTRYDPLNDNPYSATDTAYEKIKSRVCRVGKGKHCPENKIARLSRETAFVSIYRNFDDSDEWVEVLLYKGEVVTYQTRLP